MLRIAALYLLLAAPAAAGPEDASDASPTVIDASTSAVGIMLSSGTTWMKWLAANYPLKAALSKDQKKSLKDSLSTQWDERFVGRIFNDDAPGALLMKFSPSKKTLVRFGILRWSEKGWMPLARCEHAGLFDAKGSPITETGPVDVYEVYLQRRPGGLAFLITLGKTGDKLYGDVIDLSYDGREAKYVEPDDSDHD